MEKIEWQVSETSPDWGGFEYEAEVDHGCYLIGPQVQNDKIGKFAGFAVLYWPKGTKPRLPNTAIWIIGKVDAETAKKAAELHSDLQFVLNNFEPTAIH